jgi:hypothetical protein
MKQKKGSCGYAGGPMNTQKPVQAEGFLNPVEPGRKNRLQHQDRHAHNGKGPAQSFGGGFAGQIPGNDG